MTSQHVSTSNYSLYEYFLKILPSHLRDTIPADERDIVLGNAGKLPMVEVRSDAAIVSRALITAVQFNENDTQAQREKTHATPDREISISDESEQNISQPNNSAFTEEEQVLLEACLLMLSLWCLPHDCSIRGLLTLLKLEVSFDSVTPLDLIFLEIERGEKLEITRKTHRGDTASATEWLPSTLQRTTDGRKPGEYRGFRRGLSPDEDEALGAYDEFKHMCTSEQRVLTAVAILNKLYPLAKELVETPQELNEIYDATVRSISGITSGNADALEQLYLAAILSHLTNDKASNASKQRFESLLNDHLSQTT